MDAYFEARTHTSQLRAKSTSDGSVHIVGYAAVFNELSQDLGGFREEIAPGAFAETIRVDDVRALFNHDASRLLGRNRAGTLTLREDNRGLAYEVWLQDDEMTRQLAGWIRRGDISGNSFTFRTIEDEWSMVGGQERRRLLRVMLFDVGPVTFPAYPQTSLALRAGSTRATSAAQSTPKANAWRRKLALVE